MDPIHREVVVAQAPQGRRVRELNTPIVFTPDAVARARRKLDAPQDLHHLDALVTWAAPAAVRRNDTFFTATSAALRATTEALALPELRQLIRAELPAVVDARNFYAAVGVVDEPELDEQFFLNRLGRMLNVPGESLRSQDFLRPPREVAHTLSETFTEFAKPRWSLLTPSPPLLEEVGADCQQSLMPRIDTAVRTIHEFHEARRQRKTTQIKGASVGVASLGLLVGVPVLATKAYKAGSYAREGWRFVASTGRYVRTMPNAWYTTPIAIDPHFGPIYPLSPLQALVQTCIDAAGIGALGLYWSYSIFSTEVPARTRAVRGLEDQLRERGLLER